MNTNLYVNAMLDAAKRSKIKEMLAETPAEKKAERKKRAKYLMRAKKICGISNRAGIEYAAHGIFN